MSEKKKTEPNVAVSDNYITEERECTTCYKVMRFFVPKRPPLGKPWKPLHKCHWCAYAEYTYKLGIVRVDREAYDASQEDTKH